MSINDHSYLSAPSTGHFALTAWKFEANKDCTTRVAPDGCRDFIVAMEQGSAPRWFVSLLSRSTYEVPSKAGTHMQGIRLCPGTMVDQRALCRWLENKDPQTLLANDQLDEFCQLTVPLATILACLASGVQTVGAAARELGISVRTLQRIVKVETGQPPYFWLSLARIRRTAVALPQFDRMADAAAAFHYSDQAHLSREMRRWLNLSPSKVKTDIELLALLNETGYR